MIGRRCKGSDALSRPVLIARETFSERKISRERARRKKLQRNVELNELFSQVIYCGGYSGEDPPLPIPNREVKLTHADGTDPPVGRVGSRRFSGAPDINRCPGLLRIRYTIKIFGRFKKGDYLCSPNPR